MSACFIETGTGYLELSGLAIPSMMRGLTKGVLTRKGLIYMGDLKESCKNLQWPTLSGYPGGQHPGDTQVIRYHD